jgi:hypothetical protein
MRGRLNISNALVSLKNVIYSNENFADITDLLFAPLEFSLRLWEYSSGFDINYFVISCETFGRSVQLRELVVFQCGADPTHLRTS